MNCYDGSKGVRLTIRDTGRMRDNHLLFKETQVAGERVWFLADDGVDARINLKYEQTTPAKTPYFRYHSWTGKLMELDLDWIHKEASEKLLKSVIGHFGEGFIIQKSFRDCYDVITFSATKYDPNRPEASEEICTIIIQQDPNSRRDQFMEGVIETKLIEEDDWYVNDIQGAPTWDQDYPFGASMYKRGESHECKKFLFDRIQEKPIECFCDTLNYSHSDNKWQFIHYSREDNNPKKKNVYSSWRLVVDAADKKKGTVEVKTERWLSFKTEEDRIPLECLPFYDSTKMEETHNGWYEFEAIDGNKKYKYKIKPDDKGRVESGDVVCITTLPDSLIKNIEKFEVDEEAANKALLSEIKNMNDFVAKINGYTAEHKVNEYHFIKGSDFFIGSTQVDGIEKKNLYYKNTADCNIVTCVQDPFYIEPFGKRGLMVYQMNDRASIIDKQTRLPRAHIEYGETKDKEFVTFKVIVKGKEYEFKGCKLKSIAEDSVKVLIGQINGMGVVVDTSDITSLEDIIDRIRQKVKEVIGKSTGTPTQKKKKK